MTADNQRRNRTAEEARARRAELVTTLLVIGALALMSIAFGLTLTMMGTVE